MPAVQAVAVHLPMDWVILGLVAALVAIDTLRSSSIRAAVLALAAPLALLVSSQISYTAFIGSLMLKFTSPYNGLAIFCVVFVALLILIFLLMPTSSGNGAKPLSAVLAGIGAAAVLAIVLLQLPIVGDLVVISPLFHTIFGSAYRLYWLIGAYTLLAIARR